jgi:dienelactone hydrolase
MKVQYYAQRLNSWDTKLLRPTGFVVASPDDEVPRPWKLMICVHGVGERSNGTIENLENLFLGFDYNNDGVREGAAFVPDDMKKAVDKFGIVLMVPTYESNKFFEPERINELYDWAKEHFYIHDKMLLTGFSYGGGAVFKYISSSLSNAQRVAYAVPCAGVSSLVDASIPGKAGIPVHAFSNDKDPTVNVSNTINQVSNINKSNPDLKAIYTVFRRDGHGSNDEAWSFTPPKAPNGQGFTDAAENIYQVFDDIIRTGKPRQMKSGAVSPMPLPDPDPLPTPAPVTLTAEFNLSNGQLINTPSFEMDASASIGVRSGWDGYSWDVVPIEKGTWNARPEGGAYGGPKKKLINLTDGKYSITLNVRDAAGKVASKSVNVVVALQVSKIPVAFDSETDLIYYSDGSNEKGVAIYSGGKWVVKNAVGQVINF